MFVTRFLSNSQNDQPKRNNWLAVRNMARWRKVFLTKFQQSPFTSIFEAFAVIGISQLNEFFQHSFCRDNYFSLSIATDLYFSILKSELIETAVGLNGNGSF